jgi:Virulence-associated protein E
MKFWVTTFSDVYANSLHGEDFGLDELAELIGNTVAPAKEQLPILKLARFGPGRSAAGSLRHDANVVMVSGCEGDYDGESMPFQEAVTRLEAAGLAFLAHTSPSHTAAKPRWRVICPFSKELPPADRARMVNRLNGLLGGALGAESWALSQSYYYGSVKGAAAEIVVSDDEQCIDEDDDLDATAQPHRPAAGTAGAGGKPDLDQLDEHELLELIQTGEVYYGAARRLIELWAGQGIAEGDARLNLEAAFDAVPVADRGKKWSKRRSNVPRWVKQGYARVAKRKGKFFSALVDYIENTPHWRGAVRLNRFTQTIEVCDPFPPLPGQAIGAYRPLREPDDLLETLICVQADGFPTARKGVVFDALTLTAARHAYHPARDWLDSLAWDGKERINRLFLDYLPAEVPREEGKPRDNMIAYLETVATCFMVGAVARIFTPGCKLDTLPVLIGDQGYNKSQGLQALVPDPAWFSDDVSTSLIDRDTKESLVGKWIIELAEFPHIRKEIERVKAFFSRQVDRFRAPMTGQTATGRGSAPLLRPRTSSNLLIRPAIAVFGRSR